MPKRRPAPGRADAGGCETRQTGESTRDTPPRSAGCNAATGSPSAPGRAVSSSYAKKNASFGRYRTYAATIQDRAVWCARRAPGPLQVLHGMAPRSCDLARRPELGDRQGADGGAVLRDESRMILDLAQVIPRVRDEMDQPLPRDNAVARDGLRILFGEAGFAHLAQSP